MLTYTTCSGCGGQLIYTDGLNYHNGEPPCSPRLSKAERLAVEWRDAVEAGNDEQADILQRQIDELDNAAPRLLDAALTYAAWGWPVFPLRPAAKIPATRHGFKDATTDPQRIRAYWLRNPQANIGLRTGIKFDVIDLDTYKPAGLQTYLKLLDGDEIPDIHGQVTTGRAGLHLYVKPSGDTIAEGVLPGLDYRGDGGYVVAPPSQIKTRVQSWSWITYPSPSIKDGAK